MDPVIKAEEDGRIIRQLLQADEYLRAKTVFAYVGTEIEIDTTAVLEAVLRDGKRLCVPLCVSKGVMIPKEIKSIAELSEGFHGIMEPGAEAPDVEPDEIDLAIIPCVCCSSDGRRLGYGGGFYDRFLAHYKNTSVMLCRERVMREDIPVEEFDISLKMIVTDRRFIRNR